MRRKVNQLTKILLPWIPKKVKDDAMTCVIPVEKTHAVTHKQPIHLPSLHHLNNQTVTESIQNYFKNVLFFVVDK